MIKFIVLPAILASLVCFTACRNKSNPGKDVVTRRIQYDVPIRNTDPEMDWWVQNIEGSNREKLVKDILTRASSGEVKAYDFLSHKLFTPGEIATMLKRTDTISVERSTPPYDLVDTVLVTEIRISDVAKLRFLEEWSMDDKTLVFTKKVAGICPMVERLTDEGELRGYKPLFWVFFDDKYPAAFELK